MIRKASGLWIPGSRKSAPRNDDLLRHYATIVLSSKWPVATPVAPGIIKMSVGRQLDGNAITARLLEPALAFPISTERTKVPVRRNLYRQASVAALLEAAFALPTGCER